MSGSTKLALTIFAVVVAAYIVVSFVGILIGKLLPILILAAIGYVVYMVVSRKALSGGRRTLP